MKLIVAGPVRDCAWTLAALSLWGICSLIACGEEAAEEPGSSEPTGFGLDSDCDGKFESCGWITKGGELRLDDGCDGDAEAIENCEETSTSKGGVQYTRLECSGGAGCRAVYSLEGSSHIHGEFRPGDVVAHFACETSPDCEVMTDGNVTRFTGEDCPLGPLSISRDGEGRLLGVSNYGTCEDYSHPNKVIIYADDGGQCPAETVPDSAGCRGIELDSAGRVARSFEGTGSCESNLAECETYSYDESGRVAVVEDDPRCTGDAEFCIHHAYNGADDLVRSFVSRCADPTEVLGQSCIVVRRDGAGRLLFRAESDCEGAAEECEVFAYDHDSLAPEAVCSGDECCVDLVTSRETACGENTACACFGPEPEPPTGRCVGAAAPGEGDACFSNGDCQADLRCFSDSGASYCVLPCSADSDCGPGQCAPLGT